MKIRQAGSPAVRQHTGPITTDGLKVRAVVTAVYFADNEDTGGVNARASFQGGEVKAVACDVLTYGGRHRYFLPKVAVVQQRHGLNDYQGLWIPRPSTIDLRTGTAPVFPTRDSDPAQMSDAADLDGDHVLVEFLENDPSQPIITGSLPHPRANFRMVEANGSQVRSRFRGVEVITDKSGNVLLDTTKANDGDINAAGEETPSADATHGNLDIDVSNTATFRIRGVDKDGGNEKWRIEAKDGEIELVLEGGIEVNLKSGVVNLGTDAPADFVALAAKVLTELTSIIGQMNALITIHNANVVLLNLEAGLGSTYALGVSLTAATPVAAAKVKAE